MSGKVLAAAALAVWAAGLAAAENIELKLSQSTEASLAEATCLHETPSATAPTVICLMKGAKLTLVARMSDKQVVDGKEGYWYKAELPGGAEGWIFSAYFDTSGGGGKCSTPCDKSCADK